MIATAIITAPRPHATLQESIRSYRKDGQFHGQLTICSDAVHGIQGHGLMEVILNEPALGNMRNWRMALSVLCHRSPDADWLMVCEDDIVWARGAGLTLELELKVLKESAKFGKSGAQSLYLPRRHTKGMAPLARGWHGQGLQRAHKQWGAQCMVFSRGQALELLGDLMFIELTSDVTRDKNIDAVFGRCINARGKEILYRVPCLVDHTLGDGNSSLGYKEDRPDLRTDYFTGRP